MKIQLNLPSSMILDVIESYDTEITEENNITTIEGNASNVISMLNELNSYYNLDNCID